MNFPRHKDWIIDYNFYFVNQYLCPGETEGNLTLEV